MTVDVSTEVRGGLKFLKSNRNVDSLDKVKEKASVKAEAHSKKTSDSVTTNSDSDYLSDAILACSPNLHKQRSEQMSEKGHLRIPRSLHENPLYFDAHPIYQAILHRFFYLASYRIQEHNINGKIIILKPGQFCWSLRNLQKECGAKISVAFLRGAIRYFERVGFLTQTLTHKKTLITLSESILYEAKTKQPNTTSNTELTQSSHTNKEEEEYIDYDLIDARVREGKKQMKNLKGEELKLDESAIYRYMLKFPDIPTEVIKEAIERMVNQKNPIGDQNRYVEKTCRNLMNEKMKTIPKKTFKKEKPNSAPPKCTEKGITWAEFQKRKSINV